MLSRAAITHIGADPCGRGQPLMSEMRLIDLASTEVAYTQCDHNDRNPEKSIFCARTAAVCKYPLTMPCKVK